MRAIMMAAVLTGCVQPVESVTEQASISDMQAKIAATNAVIAYENQSCTNENVCAPGVDDDEQGFGFIDCDGGTSGVTCCIWLFCCTAWYLGEITCTSWF